MMDKLELKFLLPETEQQDEDLNAYEWAFMLVVLGAVLVMALMMAALVLRMNELLVLLG